MAFTKTLVHIGLGKTATTSLQNFHFPMLCRELKYDYNPVAFLNIAKQRFIYSDSEKNKLKRSLRDKNVLISHEGLLDWNPRNWNDSLDLILDLFGSNSKIIITIRDPIEYLCSVYLQKVAEGNVFYPEDFFISSKEYDCIQCFLAERSLFRYDFEKLDYMALKSECEERFSSVLFCPLSKVDNVQMYAKIFGVDKSLISRYENELKTRPTLNRSFSKLALKLTLRRERFLIFCRLKSFGSEDYQYRLDQVDKRLKGRSSRSFSSNSLYVILKTKILKRLGCLLDWRWLMQRVIDRYIPYQKYQLPENVLNYIDREVMERNRRFLDMVESSFDL